MGSGGSLSPGEPRRPDANAGYLAHSEEPPLDPALDPEIAKLARRLAPRRAVSNLSLLGLGWAVALSLVFGLLAGIWLDARLGTSPFLTLAGCALGLAGAWMSGRELIRQSRAPRG